MMKSIELTTKDLMKIRGISLRQAQRDLKYLKIIHNKDGRGKILTIREFCRYSDLDYKELKEFLRAS